MTFWRVIAWVFLFAIVLSNFHVFGFHEPEDAAVQQVTLMGIGVILCICDAVRELKKRD